MSARSRIFTTRWARRHFLVTFRGNLPADGHIPRRLLRLDTVRRRLVQALLACHSVQITSFGGAGTTMLYRTLSRCDVGLPVVSGVDWSPWKHMRTPPSDLSVRRGFRAIYLVADPRDAVLSVFRRNFQHWHVQRIEGDVLNWNFAWTLDDFIRQRRDLFLLEHHFDTWMNAKRNYPILVVNYATLWDNLDRVLAFAGLSPLDVEFPARRARTVSWQQEPAGVRTVLNELYGNLADKVSKLDCCVLHRGSRVHDSDLVFRNRRD